MTTVSDTFDEKRLRADIASVWGKHGAHVDVFDFMVKEIELLRSALVFADGVCVVANGHGLADLYNATTHYQGVLARAGCHERGKFADG